MELYRRTFRKAVALIYTAGTVVHVWILAVHSHEVLSVFSYGYSYAAVVYFGLFAWRSWTMRLAPA